MPELTRVLVLFANVDDAHAISMRVQEQRVNVSKTIRVCSSVAEERMSHLSFSFVRESQRAAKTVLLEPFIARNGSHA